MKLTSDAQNRLRRIVREVQRRSVSIGPPLSNSAISAFEHEHKIVLPCEYRAFLTHVGNGGRGPDELFKLGVYPADSVPKPEYVTSDDIERPFPFETMKVWEGQSTHDEYQSDLHVLHFGNLCLTHGGCGAHYHLIVTGPARGAVWQFAWDIGVVPVQTDFLAWYESWLFG